MTDLSDAIEECSVDAVLTRHVSVAVSKGRKTDPRVNVLPFRGSITPITGADVKRLSEGRIVGGSKLIITSQELFTSNSSECKVADIIEYKGVHYEISVVKDWYDIGGFYECVGTRIEQ